MTRVVLVGLLCSAFVAGCGSSPVRHAAAGCRLRGSISLQGATGNLLGGIAVRNVATGACRLGGFPGLTLFRSDGRRVALTVHRGNPAFPGGHPVTSLKPGRSATVWVMWSNYCGSLWNRPFTFRLRLTTGRTVAARTPMGEKCQTNGGGPKPGPGRGELSLSAFEAAGP
jgi:hypothetical protein